MLEKPFNTSIKVVSQSESIPIAPLPEETKVDQDSLVMPAISFLEEPLLKLDLNLSGIYNKAFEETKEKMNAKLMQAAAEAFFIKPANQAFRSQTPSESGEVKPINRFWNKTEKKSDPLSLFELALQRIVTEEIKTGKFWGESYQYPSTVRDLINKRLQEFTNGCENERIFSAMQSISFSLPLPALNFRYFISPS